MYFTFTVLKKYVPVAVTLAFCLFVGLTLTAYTSWPGYAPPGNGRNNGRPDSGSISGPASYWGPLRLTILAPASSLSNDPIRFRIQCSKPTIRLGESVELTITAELLNISPNLLFFQPGANAYTLKMLLPPGFEQTGGDFADYLTGELSYPARPLMSYHIRGYFHSVTPGTGFRLLRGQGQTTEQSLFVEKATVMLNTRPDATMAAHQSAGAYMGRASVTLSVVTDNAPGAGAARAAAASYRGFLDYAGCDLIAGWVMDANNLRQSQEVDVYINGVKVATVLADRVRQDVANAFRVNDFNKYGYVWVIPDYYKANVALTLSVRPTGTSTELSGSPQKTGVCPSTVVVSPPVTTPPTTVTVTPPVTVTVTPPTTVTVTPPTTVTVTPPTAVTVTPPTTTPAPGSALTMLAPTYNCATGAITFNTSGGDGTPIRFRAVGITDWTTNPNQYLDAESRVSADTPLFMIYGEQSGYTLTYSWSRQATCSGTPPPITVTPPTTVTVTPPTTVTVTPPTTVTVTPPTTVTVTPPTTVTVTPPPTNSTSGYYGYRGDTFSYTPLDDSPTTDKFPVFENDKIKVTLALQNQYSNSQTPGMGGSVFQIYDKRRPGKTLLYNALMWNREDQGAPRTPGRANRIFTGQGLSECLYQNPRPYYTTGEDGDAAIEPSLGYNPNEVGDDRANSGRLLKYGRTTDSFYTEMIPMLYGQVKAPANEVRMKKWGKLNDRALVLNYESSFNRASNEQVVTKGQESPCLYVNNMRNIKYYQGNNPYSNDGKITTITMPLASNGNGGNSTNGQRPGGVYPSEPWIGIFGDDGYGIGLMLKDNVRSAIGFWGDGGGNDSEPNMGGGYGYIAHAMNEMLDMNIRWRHRTEVIVGTVEEIRAYVYANSYRPFAKPNFKFNTAGREGWSLNSGNWDVGTGSGDHHTWDEHYTGGARNGWKIYFGTNNNAVIQSPGVIWKASDFNTIYVRMAFTGENQNWQCRFVRNGQKTDGALNLDPNQNKYYFEEKARYPNGTADREEQKVYTPVIGDGQYRVYAFKVGTKAEWRDVINQVMLIPHATSGRNTYNAGEFAVIDWISDSPNGPSN